jgi:hypothetical protein
MNTTNINPTDVKFDFEHEVKKIQSYMAHLDELQKDLEEISRLKFKAKQQLNTSIRIASHFRILYQECAGEVLPSIEEQLAL